MKLRSTHTCASAPTTLIIYVAMVVVSYKDTMPRTKPMIIFLWSVSNVSQRVSCLICDTRKCLVVGSPRTLLVLHARYWMRKFVGAKSASMDDCTTNEGPR